MQIVTPLMETVPRLYARAVASHEAQYSPCLLRRGFSPERLHQLSAVCLSLLSRTRWTPACVADLVTVASGGRVVMVLSRGVKCTLKEGSSARSLRNKASRCSGPTAPCLQTDSRQFCIHACEESDVPRRILTSCTWYSDSADDMYSSGYQSLRIRSYDVRTTGTGTQEQNMPFLRAATTK